jgi:hypothetical protein
LISTTITNASQCRDSLLLLIRRYGAAVRPEHILFGHSPLTLWSVQIHFDGTSGIVLFLALIQIDGITGSPNLELQEILYMLHDENGLIWRLGKGL